MPSSSSTIKLSSSSIRNASEASNVHLLPCKIQHNGEAHIAEYFQCSIKDGTRPTGKSAFSILDEGGLVDIHMRNDPKSVCTALSNGMNCSLARASFRGRILQGETIDIPEGYCGYIVTEGRKPVTEEEDRSFKVNEKFSKFTYWNLEDKPNLNDKIRKAMQWVNISSAIHRRVAVDRDNTPESENNTPDTIR